MLGHVLNIHTIIHEPSSLATLHILLAIILRESPLVGTHHLLATRELELRTTKGLNSGSSVLVLGADRKNDLADLNTCSHLHRLSVRSTHTGGQTICSGAGKHFVLTDDMERMGAAANVVRVLSTMLQHIFVASNTSGLERRGGKLFLLIRHKVNDEGEQIYAGLLGSAIKNTNFCLGNTTAIS